MNYRFGDSLNSGLLPQSSYYHLFFRVLKLSVPSIPSRFYNCVQWEQQGSMSTPSYQQLELWLLPSCSSSSPMVQDSWQHSSFYVFIPVNKKEEETKNASLTVRTFLESHVILSYFNLVLFSELRHEASTHC